MFGIWGRRTRGDYSIIAKDTIKMDFGNEEYPSEAENDTSCRIMEWNGLVRREIFPSEIRWDCRDVTPSERRAGLRGSCIFDTIQKLLPQSTAMLKKSNTAARCSEFDVCINAEGRYRFLWVRARGFNGTVRKLATVHVKLGARGQEGVASATD